MRKALCSVMTLSLIIFSSCSKEVEKPVNGVDNPGQPELPQQPTEQDAMAFAQTLGIGWNLGNSLDAHSNGKSDEKCWGNDRATQATFNAVKKMGFSSVRIPVTWMGHIGAAPDYKIEDAWMKRVAEIVGYAKNAGLKAIINIHHDGSATNDGNTATFPAGTWLRIDQAVNNKTVDAEIKDKITKVWTQIATRFKSEGNWLIFETFNEIHDGFWGYPINYNLYKKMNEWNQTALDAIRATGGQNAERYVGIPCYAANPAFANTTFSLPNDVAQNKLMVSVHCYDPYDYAGAAKESEWGHNSKNTDERFKESYINGILITLNNKFIKNKVPVYFGEFGCVHRGTQREEDFRKYYLEYNIKNMREHNMPVMIWDNGAAGSGAEKFGLINHGDGRYVKNADIDDAQEVVALMVKAWTYNDKNYTLKSIYNNAPI